MSTPYYVDPQQFMSDRAAYARDGIARGRRVISVPCAEGVLLAAHSTSAVLHKVSEVHDRIAFAAVGRYSEFEQLRIAAIQAADLHAYAYSAADVTCSALARTFAKTLGSAFVAGAKPLEVDMLLAEVGPEPGTDRIYRIGFDGSLTDSRDAVELGGDADGRPARLATLRALTPDAPLRQTVMTARTVLAPRGLAELPDDQLELALLDRRGSGRRFTRLDPAAMDTAPAGPIEEEA